MNVCKIQIFPSKVKMRLVVFVLLCFLSSSALLVLNKVAITEVSNAPLLLLVQIVSTVVLVGAVGLLLKNISFRPSGVVTKAYTSVAMVFLLTIYSNFNRRSSLSYKVTNNYLRVVLI